MTKASPGVTDPAGHWQMPLSQAIPPSSEAGAVGNLTSSENLPGTPSPLNATQEATVPLQNALDDSTQLSWDNVTAGLGCGRNYPPGTNNDNDGGPLLPNLRVLRLNTGWTAEVRDLISYRASLLPVRHASVIQGTTNALNYHYNSLLGSASVDDGGKERLRPRAFDTLGLMQLPKPDSIGYVWMREHVTNIEANPDGWRGLDDELMVGFA